MLFQMGNGAGHIRKRAEPVFDDLDDFFSTLQPHGIGVIIGMISEVRTSHGPTQIFPVMQKRHDDHIPARAAKDAARTDVSHMPSSARRLNGSAAAAIGMYVDFMVVVIYVQQRDIEMLPFSSA